MTHAYWLSAYHRQCKLLPPSPPGELDPDYDLLTKLETHVTRSAQLDRAWKGLSGAVARRKEFGMAAMATEKYNVYGLRLLPGGRRLLTHSQAGVRLWDLDSDSIDASMTLVASRIPATPETTVIQSGWDGWDVDMSEAPDFYQIALCSQIFRRVAPQLLLTLHVNS